MVKANNINNINDNFLTVKKHPVPDSTLSADGSSAPAPLSFLRGGFFIKSFFLFVFVVLFTPISKPYAGILETFLLFPNHEVIDTSGQTRVVLRSGLEMWVQSRPPIQANTPEANVSQPHKIYLLNFSGTGGRAERDNLFTRFFPKNIHVEAWSLNYPGYGGSAGKADLNAFPRAALEAFDQVKEVQSKESPQSPVFVTGISLGTAVALYLAKERPVDGLVLLDSPALKQQIRDFGKGEGIKAAHWRVLALLGASLLPEQLNSMENAPRVQTPALFLVGEKDRLTPPKTQQQIINAYRGPTQTVILYGADHCAFGPEPEQPSPAHEKAIDDKTMITEDLKDAIELVDLKCEKKPAGSEEQVGINDLSIRQGIEWLLSFHR